MLLRYTTFKVALHSLILEIKVFINRKVTE